MDDNTDADFGQLSRAFSMYIHNLELLHVQEGQLWAPLIHWCCKCSNINPVKSVSRMSPDEPGRVSVLMKPFCQSHLFRILGFETMFFVSEVEPLGVFPPSEVLLRHRFDASAHSTSLDKVFTIGWLQFIHRIRHMHVCMESRSHPPSSAPGWD